LCLGIERRGDLSSVLDVDAELVPSEGRFSEFFCFCVARVFPATESEPSLEAVRVSLKFYVHAQTQSNLKGLGIR